MQPSHAPMTREGRAGGDPGWRSLMAVAALLWVVSIVFVFWVDTHRDHPNYTGFGIAATGLIAVLTPAAFGAAVSWRHPLPNRGRDSAFAGMLSEWAFLAMAPVVIFFRYYEESVYFLQHPDR